MPHREDAVFIPNSELRAARLRLPSPRRPDQRMSRAELADAVNAAIDEANTKGRNVEHLYVAQHWVGKLERGRTRWPHEERRAALRRVLKADSDADLGLYSPRQTDAGYLAAPAPDAVLAWRAVDLPQLAMGPDRLYVEHGPPPSDGQGRDEDGGHDVRRRSIFVGLAAAAASPFVAGRGGAEPEHLDQTAAQIAALRRFFSRYDSLRGEVPDGPIDVADVRQRVDAAHRAYQAAEYERVVYDLPALLSLAEPLRLAAGGCPRRAALASYVNAYAMAAKLLTKMGAADLALLSADRAAAAAVDAGSAEARGIAAYQVVCALLRAGRAEDAERLAVPMAEVVQREARPVAPVAVSVAGALWLIGAVIAGRRTDRGEASRRLDQADALATMLGRDGNFAWTAFGPTNVAIHRVSVAAELGDPAEAMRAADAVDPRRLPVGLNSRRAQVHLDLAWAQVQRKRDADALLHLMEAERTAPEMIRYNVTVHELAREMLARQQRPTTSALHRFAVRAGVLD